MKLDTLDVLDWLDASKHEDEYEDYLSSHLDGTCEWLLNHPDYLTWMSDATRDTDAKFLWLHGPAGFGKTMLSAWLIRHMKQNLKSIVAFRFLSSQAPKMDELDGVIRTWITHIARQDSRALILCQNARRKQRSRRAARNDVWNLLHEVSTQSSSFVFVLDGLDEYPRINDNRSRFLQDIKRALQSTGVRVLITSRDEVDIESELGTLTTRPLDGVMFECKISRQTMMHDVDLYSQSVVARKFPSHNETSRRELSAQMAEKAGGMFLWVKMQEHSLRNTQNKKTIERIIQAMPPGLPLTYKRNLDSVLESAEQDRNRALDILRWLTYGCRALTVQEMAEALAIDLDMTKEVFQEDDIPAEIDKEYSNNEIRGLCYSLVELRDGENSKPSFETVHLVHASVREYLSAILPIPTVFRIHPPESLRVEMHHAVLAACCLRFLNDPQAWCNRDTGEARSFTLYAAQSWFYHVRMSGDYYSQVASLVHVFMNHKNVHFRNWRILWESHTNAGFPSVACQNDASAMYYACLFDLLPTMEFLHDKEGASIDSIGGVLGTPLQVACAGGNDNAFNRLMLWGVDVGVEGGWYRNAISAAASNGRLHMIQALLNRQNETDIPNSQLREATMMAAARGHPAVVKLLLENSANFLSFETNADTPLHLAAGNNQIEVVKFLLGSDVCLDFHESVGSPTYSRLSHSHLTVTTSWLDRKGGLKATPLHRAAQYGNSEVVAILLASGAKINAQTESGRTPLYLALENNYSDTAKLLLNLNADVSIGTMQFEAPIHMAAERGPVDMMRSIIEKGADVNSRDANAWTALHVASAVAKPDIEIIALLLQHGADPNARAEFGGTALHFAAWSGHSQMVVPLLERGAAIDARTLRGETALIRSLRSQKTVVTELLLCQEADPTIPDEDGVTSLFYAAGNGNLQLVRSLIAKGCDVNATTKFGETLLREAIIRPTSDEIVLELIHRGADLSKNDQFGMKCCDWLQLLRPHLCRSPQNERESGTKASGPDDIFLRRKVSELAAAIRKNEQQRPLTFRHLSRYLLMLGVERDAILAEQLAHLIGLAVCCDGCEEDLTRDEPFYSCETCPDTDLCEDCMVKHQETPLLVLCREHKFLRIVASEASIRPYQTKLFDGWLLDIEERYKATDKPENV